MKEAILALSKRIEEMQDSDSVKTEEGTKQAFVLPFLQILGYDVFKPTEVIPEYTADIGIKQGEKIDYAIMLDGNEPSLLIECKACHSKLSTENEGQLIRYFNTLKARFAILTNGIIYKFYSDFERPNIMDRTPFFEINLLNPKSINYNELEKFSKKEFNVEKISTTAKRLKTINTVRSILNQEFSGEEPSEEFTRCIFEKIPNRGSFSPTVKKELPPIIKAAIESIINERIQISLNETLAKYEKKSEELLPPENIEEPTPEEKDAFNIIRAIASEIADPERVKIRDAKSYCAILFDDNNRRPVCRLFFNDPEKKSIVFFDTVPEGKVKIGNLSEIFLHKEHILATVRKYL